MRKWHMGDTHSLAPHFNAEICCPENASTHSVASREPSGGLSKPPAHLCRVAQAGTHLHTCHHRIDCASSSFRTGFGRIADKTSAGTDNLLMTKSSEPPRQSRPFLRHPLVLTGLAVLVIAVGLGAYWFQPWKLFTNTTVDEAPPSVATGEASPGPWGTTTGAAVTEVVVQGDLVSQEHETSGTVQLLRLPDASLIVRVEDLNTSDGPDLKVLLTDASVTPGLGGAGVFDDGRWVDLGPLKGNHGSANYPVPADTDIDGLTSVSIWCDRFNVSFGAAELAPIA